MGKSHNNEFLHSSFNEFIKRNKTRLQVVIYSEFKSRYNEFWIYFVKLRSVILCDQPRGVTYIFGGVAMKNQDNPLKLYGKCIQMWD